MVIGVSEESDKDFDVFSVENMLDLHDRVRWSHMFVEAMQGCFPCPTWCP